MTARMAGFLQKGGVPIRPLVVHLRQGNRIFCNTCIFLGGDIESNGRPDPMARRGWIWLIATGFAVSIVGIIVGLQKAGPLCGSPLIPQSREAETFDALRTGSRAAGECYRNIDAAAIPTWILIALGILVVLTGVIVRVVTINRFSAVSPSIATRLDELARRHKQGQISTEEFKARRAELLNGL